MKGVNKPSVPCGEDEALALAAQGGDRAAAETLLGRYKNAVRGIARSYFLEGGDAEDLVQEGMIGLYGAVTDYRADGESIYQTDLTGDIALVVGGEDSGVSALTRKKCDKVLSLPLRGKVNSLNASVALGIAVYEALRQRS